MVVAPSQAQAQLWWDEIVFQIENSPALGGNDFLISKKQQPYYYMRFGNGSVIKIFTAGSKSGKGADSVRSQSPRGASGLRSRITWRTRTTRPSCR